MRFDDEFSVVIPVYAGDSAEHFKDAVHSVLNQTISPKEVIIVVDGPLRLRAILLAD